MKHVLKISCVLSLLLTSAAQAQIYKSVGPDGRVIYSDTPPVSVSRVEAKPIPAGTNSVSLPFELAAAVKSSPVTLYTTKNCPGCDEGRRLLQSRGIPFSEKTVNSNEDIEQFRKLGGDGQLPVLAVGRHKERGFETDAWNDALTAAGYPQTNLLPKTWRNPPAQALAPAVPAQPVQQARSADSDGNAIAVPPAGDLPPAAGNAPPGFRF